MREVAYWILILILTVAYIWLWISHERKEDRCRKLADENSELKLTISILQKSISIVEYERDYLGNEIKEVLDLYDQKSAEAEQIADVACPHEAHIWDRDGDIIRCRRCGLTRRVEDGN